MRFKGIIVVILAGILLVAGACGPAKPTTPITPPLGGVPVTPAPDPTPNVPTNVTPGGSPPASGGVTPPPAPPPPVAAQGPNEVWTAGNSFQPGILTVPAGTTVVWKNKDSMVHTVVSNTGLFYGTLEVGGSYNYTFTKPGNYEYNCDIHPGMAGAIHVQ